MSSEDTEKKKKNVSEKKSGLNTTSVVTGINSVALMALVYKLLEINNKTDCLNSEIEEMRCNMNILNLFFKSKSFRQDVNHEVFNEELDLLKLRFLKIEERLERIEKTFLSEAEDFFEKNEEQKTDF